MRDEPVIKDCLSQFYKASRLDPYMKFREKTQVNQCLIQKRACTLHVLFVGVVCRLSDLGEVCTLPVQFFSFY